VDQCTICVWNIREALKVLPFLFPLWIEKMTKFNSIFFLVLLILLTLVASLVVQSHKDDELITPLPAQVQPSDPPPPTEYDPPFAPPDRGELIRSTHVLVSNRIECYIHQEEEGWVRGRIVARNKGIVIVKVGEKLIYSKYGTVWLVGNTTDLPPRQGKEKRGKMVLKKVGAAQEYKSLFRKGRIPKVQLQGSKVMI